MASTSGVKQNCCSNTKCERAIGASKPGWEFLGREVDLCNQCYIVYMKKQFCNIYHKNSTTWSFCKLCNKKIHCPCMVSLDLYTILGEEGIICKGCAPQDATLVSNSEELMHECTNTTTPLASIPQTRVETNEVIIIDEDDSHEEQRSTPPPLAQARKHTEKPGVGTSNEHDINRYAPKMTDDELRGIFKGSNEEVIPLFEKILSASDTGKSGRLVLPKRCAEEFFPSVDHDQCQHIEVQDSEGKEWKFRLRMWLNNNHKMYVLEGFKPFVRSKKLIQGNIVTFSKLVPQGKLAIGIRKGPSSSSQGNDTTSTNEHVPKDKITRKPNVATRVQPGIVIVEGGVGVRRKSSEVDLTENTIGKQKKRLEVVERAPELVGSPRGNNVPSDVAKQGFERRYGKGNVTTSTNKHVPKDKITRKPNVVRRVQPGIVIVEGGVGARRKSSQVDLSGNTTGKQKKRLEVVESVDSPCGNSVPSNVVKQGFEKRHGKGILRRSTNKPMQKFKTKSTRRNSNIFISTLEPGLSKPVETEVTEIEYVVALPAPLRWIKKHHRHRSACMCKVCMPPAVGSMQNLPSQSPSHQGGTSNSVREEPKSSNGDAQMTSSSDAEDNQNINNVTASQSKCLLFDLNVLPEIDGERVDTMNHDQETSSSEMKAIGQH